MMVALVVVFIEEWSCIEAVIAVTAAAVVLLSQLPFCSLVVNTVVFAHSVAVFSVAIPIWAVDNALFRP